MRRWIQRILSHITGHLRANSCKSTKAWQSQGQSHVYQVIGCQLQRAILIARDEKALEETLLSSHIWDARSAWIVQGLKQSGWRCLFLKRTRLNGMSMNDKMGQCQPHFSQLEWQQAGGAATEEKRMFKYIGTTVPLSKKAYVYIWKKKSNLWFSLVELTWRL